MTNKQVARLLKDTSGLIDLTGGNTFRARALENAARTIERLEKPVAALLEAGMLTEVKGIGAGIASQVEEIVDTGSLALREELLQGVPPGVLDMLYVKGLGAKKVRLLWQSLGITSLPELEDAARAGVLAGLEGFGAKTQDKIIREIELLRKYSGKQRYAQAFPTAHQLWEVLKESDAVQAVDYAGEICRNMEIVSSVDLVAASRDPLAVKQLVESLYEPVESRQSDLGTELTSHRADGLPLRVLVAPPERFGYAKWRITGSDEHCTAFEALYGTPEAAADEADIYTRAGLPFIPPELRENLGEFEAAASGKFPALLETEDLRGTLHNHTTYSDGAHTLEQMAAKAREMGLEYIGICDHSRSLAIANGLPIERVKEQQAAIRQLNEQIAAEGGAPFRIFSGTESDILADGSLDYPDVVLASFDLVVVSIHSGFNMTREAATARLIRAIENPYTTILGHATGRLLLSREGYPIDHERVIEACAANNVAIELNANPHRLDMDWRWIRRATEQGILISINPDAHATTELENVKWGVRVARKGWLTAGQCLNAMPLNQFTDWLNTRRPVVMKG